MPNPVVHVSDPLLHTMGEIPTFSQSRALEARQKPVTQRRRKVRSAASGAHHRADVCPVEVRMADQLVDSRRDQDEVSDAVPGGRTVSGLSQEWLSGVDSPRDRL